jgi:hypothetical protein
MIELAGQESGYMLELETERTIEAQGRIENLQELAGVAMETAAREPTRAWPTSSSWSRSSASRTTTRRRTRASR